MILPHLWVSLDNTELSLLEAGNISGVYVNQPTPYQWQKPLRKVIFTDPQSHGLVDPIHSQEALCLRP